MKNNSSPGVIARRRPPSSEGAGMAAVAATGTLALRDPGRRIRESYPLDVLVDVSRRQDR